MPNNVRHDFKERLGIKNHSFPETGRGLSRFFDFLFKFGKNQAILYIEKERTMKKITLTLLCFFLWNAAYPQETQHEGSASSGSDKGKWEFGVHFSSWNINVIAPLIEENFIPDVEDYTVDSTDYQFSSNGSNYGLELRFYPGGRNGSFSIGLSYERNNFKTKINGTFSGVTEEDFPVEGNVNGRIDLFPHSFNLSFRWDLWPQKKIHPYFGFGLGLGPLDGTLRLQGSALVTYDDLSTETEVIDEDMTLEEALDELSEEEDEEFPLHLMPILHVNFGLRVELVGHLSLLGEVAVYNGIIFRAGLAYRF